MISKVLIRNFKCLRDVKIDLERFTILVGPNASGKSSILQALDLLCQVFRIAYGNHPYDGDIFQAIDENLSQVVSHGSKDPVELVAEVGRVGYRYRPHSPSAPSTRPRSTQAKWNGGGHGVAPALVSKAWKPLKLQNQSTPLPYTVLLRLEASKLVQPTPASHDPTAMAPDGSGLHTALASMTLNDPDSWQRLQADLRLIIPTIRRLRHTPTKPNQPSALLFDTIGADSLPASQVSEGTLLILGLLAALHAPGRPSLVLLDDLDRGLHPKAQKDLITLLRSLLDTNPDLQIVATTHSPYMLDCMRTDEVRMTFLGDDGATVCAALTSHPKYPKWKDEMTPGEMWSLFGEKWLVEQEVPA